MGVGLSTTGNIFVQHPISYSADADKSRGTTEFLHCLVEDGAACKNHISPGRRETGYPLPLVESLGFVEEKLFLQCLLSQGKMVNLFRNEFLQPLFHSGQ